MSVNEFYTIFTIIAILLPGVLGVTCFNYFMNMEIKKEIPFFLLLYIIIEFAVVISVKYVNSIVSLDAFLAHILYSIFGVLFGVAATILFEGSHLTKKK